jgi:chemotaxis protein methyltransferase CheR
MTWTQRFLERWTIDSTTSWLVDWRSEVVKKTALNKAIYPTAPALKEEPVAISEEEMKALIEAIHKRHGIDFRSYERGLLKQKIGYAIAQFNFTSPMQLWAKLLSDRAFIQPFMDGISLGLISMFRDAMLWEKLKEILRESDHGTEPLRIWHAGCSTGEEVYTMGIVLKEAGIKRPYSVWATDMNEASIEVAKKGQYEKLKAEEFVENYAQYNPAGRLSKYYTSSRDVMRFDPKLISHVTFAPHNLIMDPFDKKFDIIFCRNVMIYFDNDTKAKLFDKFHHSLNQGGCLIIGLYDAIIKQADKNKFELYDMNARIFSRI